MRPLGQYDKAISDYEQALPIAQQLRTEEEKQERLTILETSIRRKEDTKTHGATWNAPLPLV